MNKLLSGLKWALGKDGSTVTQYMILYILIEYQLELVEYGIPKAIIYAFVGIVLNLNNNALKAEINKIWDKFKKSDALLQFMKFGMNFEEAMLALNSEVKTEITTFPKPNKSPFIEPIEIKKEPTI